MDFTKPTRQSYIAILMIMYKLYKSLFRQLLPFLAIYLIGSGSGRSSKMIGITFGVIAVIGSIFGTISFFKYYFFLADDELVIQKGVFQKKHINIPFERIQTVDFSQNILHQIFNVVALKIDTAGSSGTEFQFDALSKDKADELRRLIFSKKAAIHKEEDSNQEEIKYEEGRLPAEPILKLGFGRLLLVGLTENHFRSFGLIIVFGFWIMDILEDLGFGWDYLEDEVNVESVIFAGIATAVVAAIIFLFLSMIISLVRTVLQYFDLSFVRHGNGFRILSGLFNRREIAAMDNKIQIVQWSRNVLQKMLGFYEISLKQASSVEISSKKSIRIPGSSLDQVDKVHEYLYDSKDLRFENKFDVSIHYFIRPTIYFLLFALVVIAIHFVFGVYKYVIPFVIFITFIIVSRYYSYKKKSFQYNDKMLKINGGTFGNDASLLPMHKIQSVKKIQNIYQRRRNLASLYIYTASGKVGIPYIKEELADEMFDYLIYKVEKSEEYWM